VPVPAADLLVDLADALARSGPFELGVSPRTWLRAGSIADLTVASLRADPPRSRCSSAPFAEGSTPRTSSPLPIGLIALIASASTITRAVDAARAWEVAVEIAPDERPLLAWRLVGRGWRSRPTDTC
jgi:hypothetical protein